MAAQARGDDAKPEVRFGLLYGIVISILVEYGMLKFFLAHSGKFERVEDYIQVALAAAVAIFFAVLGIRYAVLLAGDLRNRD
jgi:formate-dependent nitrite reductase membrane component NrfD